MVRMTALEALEWRYDGAPPAGALMAAVGGRIGGDAVAVAAIHQHEAHLCRVGLSRRRGRLSALQASGDAWLLRLGAALAWHRAAALAA